MIAIGPVTMVIAGIATLWVVLFAMVTLVMSIVDVFRKD